VDAGSIKGIGIGRASVPLLMRLRLIRVLNRSSSRGALVVPIIIDSRIHRYAYEQVLPGVIRHFDLPDLVKAITPRTVSVRGSVDAMSMTDVR
jgi:hypothetical protein